MAATKDYLVLQANNNHWSNEQLGQACTQLKKEEYFADRPSFFGSIHATLAHIVEVDQLYLERLYQLPLISHPQFVSFGDYQLMQRLVDQSLIDYVERVSETELADIIEFTLMDGITHCQVPCYRVLLHLFMHQIHHRGQVHNMLSQTSVVPPQLDEFYF